MGRDSGSFEFSYSAPSSFRYDTGQWIHAAAVLIQPAAQLLHNEAPPCEGNAGT